MSGTIKSTLDDMILEIPYFAREIVDMQYILQPEFKRYGSSGLIKSIDDAKYNLLYLFSAVDLGSVRLFQQYINWIKELLKNQNLPVTTIECFYSCTGDFLKSQYDSGLLDSGLYDKVCEYIACGLAVLKNNESVIELYPDLNNPFKNELEIYSEYILSGDKKSALQLIIKLADNDPNGIKNIYKFILQPFQIRLGNLWHSNKISVGQEHYATAVSQYAMSMLYDKIFSLPKKNKVFLGTCVEGELHEIGIRMICDYIESCGWNTYYLGANLPNRGIIDAITKISPDVIGISCTMPFNTYKIKRLVDEIRKAKITTPVIVGGYPFNIDTDLWSYVGADGYSRDFDDAYNLVESLSGGQS